MRKRDDGDGRPQAIGGEADEGGPWEARFWVGRVDGVERTAGG